MARIRTIKPEFWTSPSTRSMSPLARLLFIGTWNLADDDGRLLWDRDYLRGHLFMSDGLSDAHIDELMEACVRAQVILPYVAGGVSYAQVANFRKHQVINRPSKSKLPPPPANPQVTATFTEPSVNTPTPITEHSVPEQGTGNREQGNHDDSPVTQTGTVEPSSSSKLGITNLVLDTLVEQAVVSRRAHVHILNEPAYRQGVRGNLWREHGATICSMVEQGHDLDAIVRAVRAIDASVAAGVADRPRPNPAVDWVQARWQAGWFYDDIAAELSDTFTGPDAEAAMNYLDHLAGSVGEDAP